jgi:hypothetical protein
MKKPTNLLIIGGCLLIIGVALPFLMITRLLEPNLFLSFLSHGCSTAGFIIGFIGIAVYFRTGK